MDTKKVTYEYLKKAHITFFAGRFSQQLSPAFHVMNISVLQCQGKELRLLTSTNFDDICSCRYGLFLYIHSAALP